MKQLELEDGPHRHVAAGPNLTWPETMDLLEGLTGQPIRRPKVSGAVLRGLGTIGDVAKRVYDFDFPLTRDAMDFATMWPGADGSATTRELGLEFRSAEESYTDTLRWMHRAGHLEKKHIGKLAD